MPSEPRRLLPNSRLVWLLRRKSFTTGRARARGFWTYIVRGYEYEICMDCGGRVGTCTGSWWRADDALWREIVGAPGGILCPPCFTSRGDALNLPIRWEAVLDAE